MSVRGSNGFVVVDDGDGDDDDGDVDIGLCVVWCESIGDGKISRGKEMRMRTGLDLLFRGRVDRQNRRKQDAQARR